MMKTEALQGRNHSPFTTKATPGARGTSTLNKILLDAAEKAARQAKFSRKPDAIEQTGTITYTFKLQGE